MAEVFVVLAEMDYDSNWVVGVSANLDGAKALAQEKTGASEWQRATIGWQGQQPILGDDIEAVGEFGHGDVETACDSVLIQRWEVEP